MYYVYLLQSQKDFKYYIGCSSREPNARLAEHNFGMVKSTRARRPLKIVYFEKYLDKKSAYKREWHLKHPCGYQDKLNIIENLGL